MNNKFKCPECEAELETISSIRTMSKDMTISKTGVVTSIPNAVDEYISTDAYECPECFADITSAVKDF